MIRIVQVLKLKKCSLHWSGAIKRNLYSRSSLYDIGSVHFFIWIFFPYITMCLLQQRVYMCVAFIFIYGFRYWNGNVAINDSKVMSIWTDKIDAWHVMGIQHTYILYMKWMCCKGKITLNWSFLNWFIWWVWNIEKLWIESAIYKGT